MRLWHKDLLDVLPRQQLVSQWRECCLIAQQWATKGTPNHLLVNRVLYYPLSHFATYTQQVISEMHKRGYRVSESAEEKYLSWIHDISTAINQTPDIIRIESVFEYWHNDRYLVQCYRNLEEKFDCGGITEPEWYAVQEKFYSTHCSTCGQRNTWQCLACKDTKLTDSSMFNQSP